MEEHELRLTAETSADRSELSRKKQWETPKLAFVEPALTKHGELTEVTGQDPFFGAFTP
jgi:hypothetical protein